MFNATTLAGGPSALQDEVNPTSAYAQTAAATHPTVIAVEPFALWRYERRHPHTSSTPLASLGPDGLVRYANPAARAHGVQAGMSQAGAKQRCPHLVAKPEAGRDHEAAWTAWLHDLLRFTPRVQPIRLGLAAADLTASEADGLARTLHARVAHARTLQDAQLLAPMADVGSALHAAALNPQDRLDAAPLRLLGTAGLTAQERERLQWLGVTRIGQLRAWTQSQRQAYLGATAGALKPFLDGPKQRTLPYLSPPPMLSAGHAFDEPAFEPFEIDPILDALVRQLHRRLAGRQASVVRVVCETHGLESSGTRRAKRPTSDAARLRRLARHALEDSGLQAAGLDSLRIELSGLVRTADAVQLWPWQRRLQDASEAVHARFPGQARRFALVDPHALRDRQRWQLHDRASGRPIGPATPGRTPSPTGRASVTEKVHG
jgi:nucleotidyltransferase/DNA polymerase involved in DNA repair